MNGDILIVGGFQVGRFMQYISHLITKMLRMFKLNNNNWTMLT